MKSGWRDHKGTRYLFCDYSGFGMNYEGIIQEANAADALILLEPENSVVALIDFRGTIGSLNVVDYFRKSTVRTRKYVKKNAIIGISGIRLVFLEEVIRITGHVAKVFDDIEEAKNWLTTDS